MKTVEEIVQEEVLGEYAVYDREQLSALLVTVVSERDRLLDAARRFCSERGVDLREVAIAYGQEALREIKALN